MGNLKVIGKLALRLKWRLVQNPREQISPASDLRGARQIIQKHGENKTKDFPKFFPLVVGCVAELLDLAGVIQFGKIRLDYRHALPIFKCEIARDNFFQRDKYLP